MKKITVCIVRKDRNTVEVFSFLVEVSVPSSEILCDIPLEFVRAQLHSSYGHLF